MALTKAKITEAIETNGKLSKKQSIETTEMILKLIKDTLTSGEDVLISGFGKFCVKQKEERRGRNPATGRDLILKPRKVITFKCSAKLRDLVNDG